jgi:threonine/homoserine/homoserine lactone efflux protein
MTSEAYALLATLGLAVMYLADDTHRLTDWAAWLLATGVTLYCLFHVTLALLGR